MDCRRLLDGVSLATDGTAVTAVDDGDAVKWVVSGESILIIPVPSRSWLMSPLTLLSSSAPTCGRLCSSRHRAVYRILVDQGLSQRRLAELIDQTQSEVSEILKGRQTDVEVIGRLTRTLEAEARYYGGGAGVLTPVAQRSERLLRIPATDAVK